MAGQEGFEPPTLGFGVRCSAVRATGLLRVSGLEFQAVAIPAISVTLETRNYLLLLGFLVSGVLAAPTTVLAQLNSFWRILFILRRCVISPFALTAG